MLTTALLQLTLWTPAHIPGDRAYLRGTWQSCREDDGGYGERIFQYRVNGRFLWELHLGPRREFSLFRTPQPDEHTHDDVQNWLVPHEAVLENDRAVLDQRIRAMNLHVSAHLAGGSFNDCETFTVVVEPLL